MRPDAASHIDDVETKRLDWKETLRYLQEVDGSPLDGKQLVAILTGMLPDDFAQRLTRKLDS